MIVMSLVVLEAPAWANRGKKVVRSSSQSAGAPYGMAGCGLGSLIIQTDDVLPQIFAATFNATGYQTSGITSGTSNCVESRTKVAEIEQNVYVTANLASLSRDAARGEGEVMDGLAEVLGCYEKEGQMRLKEASRAHYADLFATTDPQAVLNRYLALIEADPLLVKGCVKAS